MQLNFFKNYNFTQKETFIIRFSALLHLLAAFFSQGFHKLDEQTGIMRYTAYKLGAMEEAQLISEYQNQIRPWLQPYFYSLIGKIQTLFIDYNPFSLALALRLVSSLIGFYAIYLFYKVTKKYFKESWQKLVLCFSSFLLWHLPFFHARTTSENFSTSFLMFGLYLLLKNSNYLLPSNDKNKNTPKNLELFFAGVLLFMSFIFRFQTSVIVFFALMWPLVTKNISIKQFCFSVLGMSSMLALNTYIDMLGYGFWTFTPWKYFEYNIIKGVADSFGIVPWYTYFTKILVKGIPPVSLVFIIPFLIEWIKSPKSYITWMTLPFFIVHCYVGHKEPRFIWILGTFTPILLTKWLGEFHHSKFVNSTFFRRFATFTIFVNVMVLLVATLKPAYSTINLYKVLYSKQITKLHVSDGKIREFPYYLSKGFSQVEINDVAPTGAWVLSKTVSSFDNFEELNCKSVFSNYPLPMKGLFNLKVLKRSKFYSLWKCP